MKFNRRSFLQYSGVTAAALAAPAIVTGPKPPLFRRRSASTSTSGRPPTCRAAPLYAASGWAPS